MKKIHLLAGAVLVSLISFTSCSKNIEPVEQNQPAMEAGPAIECVIPSDTKTYVDSASVLWNTGDEVYVVDIANNITKTYTLTSGAGTKNGVFECSAGGFGTGTNVTVFTKTTNKDKKSDNYWIFNVPASPALVGYGRGDDKSSKSMVVPMYATGVIAGGAESFYFNHLTSMVRLKVVNNFADSKTIKTVQLVSGADKQLGGDCRMSLSDNTVEYYAPVDICATGDVTIPADGTTYFDFIVRPDASKFIVAITDSEGSVYYYEKSSSDMVPGGLYTFPTTLNDARKAVKYKVFINGDEKDFNPASETEFPVIPASESTVRIKSNIPVPITATEWNNIQACLKILPDSVKYVDFDLKEVKGMGKYDANNISAGREWKYTLAKNAKVRDFYLPDDITALTKYSSFAGSTYLRWRVSPSVKYILYVNFSEKGTSVDKSAGFYVDSDNTSFSSEGGVLYDKKGTTLRSFPTFTDSTDIIVKEGVTALGTYAIQLNGIVRTITLPSTLKSIHNNNFVAYMSSLHTIFCKSSTPPTGLTRDPACSETGNHYIVVDTGDSDKDKTAKTEYQTWWSSSTSRATTTKWTVVTKAEYDKALSLE